MVTDLSYLLTSQIEFGILISTTEHQLKIIILKRWFYYDKFSSNKIQRIRGYGL